MAHFTFKNIFFDEECCQELVEGVYEVEEAEFEFDGLNFADDFCMANVTYENAQGAKGRGVMFGFTSLGDSELVIFHNN